MLFFKMCFKAIPLLGLRVANPAAGSAHIVVLTVTATMGAFLAAYLTVSLKP
jgi:hypothetical protein